jgi:hypothetical protein
MERQFVDVEDVHSIEGEDNGIWKGESSSKSFLVRSLVEIL